MAIVLSFIIAKPSALSKVAGHPFASKSINKVFLTGLILFAAKTEGNFKPSTVLPEYTAPEVTGVAPLILIT